MIKILKDKLCLKLKEKNISSDLMDIKFSVACIDNIKLAKYIFNNYNINIHNNHECPFRLACENGNLPVAQWLYETALKKGKPINIHIYDDIAFRHAAKFGHLEVLKWLIKLGNINIHIKSNYAFRHACKNGHYHVAKWLYDNYKIDISSKNDYAFIKACKSGYLIIINWLYALYKQDSNWKYSDITIDYNLLFMECSEKGHHLIVKWLYTHFKTIIDIRAFMDYAFRLACINNHIKVALLLCDLCCDYEVVIKNNKIIAFDYEIKK